MKQLVEHEIEIGKWLVRNNLVKQHFHSVELFMTKEENKYPVFRRGQELMYVGPDDSKGRYSYTRLNGSPAYSETLSPGSCDKGYIINVPLRLVVFNDNENDDRQHLLQRIMGVSFLQHVKFNRYQTDALTLAREESPVGEFAFDGKTFYIAIDLTVRVILQSDHCTQDNCVTFQNPIC